MSIDAALLNRYCRALTPVATHLSPRSARRHPTPCRAVLFDIYGTLLISGAGDIDAGRAIRRKPDLLRRLLDRYAIAIPPERLARDFQQAIERSHASAREKGIDHPEIDVAKIWQTVLTIPEASRARRFAIEYELLINPVWPMPGADDLFQTLKGKGLCLGLISNAQFYTVPVMEALLGHPLADIGIDHRFCFYSWLEGHAKPSPVMFERACSALKEAGVPASAVIYVGNDMRNDMLPAASVGFSTALFAGDRRSLRLREDDDACRGLTPDLIITDLRQLKTCADPAAQ